MTEKIKKLIEKIKDESETDYYQIKIVKLEDYLIGHQIKIFLQIKKGKRYSYWRK